MAHLSELELIELAGGRLPPQRHEACRAHLAGCVACQARASAAMSVWAATEQWQVKKPSADLVDLVLDRLGPPVLPLQAQRRLLWRALRVAAMFALAIGTGHVLGRLPGLTPGQADVAPVDEAQAAESLVLEEWHSASGWVEAFLDEPADNAEEDRG